jgi:hypothetical protein
VTGEPLRTPYVNENVLLNSQSPGTCGAHRGTLSSLGSLLIRKPSQQIGTF